MIDTGVMKSVPYVSYRFADAYEMNVYGDPQRPACIEIGVYADRLQTPESKRNCLTFIYTLLPDLVADPGAKGRKFSGDITRIRNLTYEITAPDAPDAYGAWWVSVYDETLLDRSRASDVEIRSISASTAALKNSPTADSEDWTPADLNSVRRNVQPEPTPAAQSTRPTAAISSITTPTSGRVYVKSYQRKDGTYVHSHSRKK